MAKIKSSPVLIKYICFFLTIVLLLLTPTVRVNAQAIKDDGEFQGVWISYLEFLDRLKDPKTGVNGFTEERFHQMVDEMFDNVAAMNMNAVVVHVRPFGDAMYPSKYFPWSRYISGTQGKNPGFDPLEYMVSAAHERGLQFHAWINPYRITSDSTDINKLSKDNLARKWLTNTSKDDDRRVLSFGGSLYYNPSDNWVQAYIRYGIEEIVENYEVDGIHFDDYFYPTLGSNYKKNFDYKEYVEYSNWCKENGVKTKGIADWRRNNVNRLVKNIYSDIKDIDEDVVFGISPGGFLDYLLLDDRYYTDIKTWLSKPGYIDYICPQLYWSFDNKDFPYDKTLDRWLALRTNKDVKMYVGIAAYRAGSTLEKAWKDPNILKDMIDYGRGTGLVEGYIYFRYDFFYKQVTRKAIGKLLDLLI